MSVFVSTSADPARPLVVDGPAEGFKEWFRERRAAIQRARTESDAAGGDHRDPAHMKRVNEWHAFRVVAYTNVTDPEKGRQQGLIAHVLGTAGALRLVTDMGGPSRCWQGKGQQDYHMHRLETDYRFAVEILSRYTGADPDVVKAAGEDQAAVIKAATAHL